MIFSAYWGGIKEHTSSKGNKYADLLVYAMLDDGDPDLEQTKIRTFDEDVIKVARDFKRDDVVLLDLVIRDATCSGISKG